MKVSLALVSLGLCIAPAVAQSIANVVMTSEKESWDEEPVPEHCYTFTDPDIPVLEIDVAAPPDVRCTFYLEGECQGDTKLRLKDGEHKFTRKFYAGSFKCQD